MMNVSFLLPVSSFSEEIQKICGESNIFPFSNWKKCDKILYYILLSQAVSSYFFNNFF